MFKTDLTTKNEI